MGKIRCRLTTCKLNALFTLKDETSNPNLDILVTELATE